MISEIIIPELGATGGDVTLEEWLVKPGQVVKTGQALYVVATDKATVEVEAYRDGVIQTILVPQGETVPLGTVIALLADSMDEKTELPEREPVEYPLPHLLVLPVDLHQSQENAYWHPLSPAASPQKRILICSP